MGRERERWGEMEREREREMERERERWREIERDRERERENPRKITINTLFKIDDTTHKHTNYKTN